jgi:hypothetical protein
MPASSHVLDRVQVTFDDGHAVANAGLILPATLLDHDLPPLPRTPSGLAKQCGGECLLFVAYGGLHVQRGVASPLVVPADVVEHGEFGRRAGGPAVAVDEFVLDRGEEAFTHGVVVG